MPEEKKGRGSHVYSSPKTGKDMPKRGERTSTNKARTKPQPKHATKAKKMGY